LPPRASKPPEKHVVVPVLASFIVEDATIAEQVPWWEVAPSAEEASTSQLAVASDPSSFQASAAIGAVELVAAGAAWVNPCMGTVVISRRSYSQCMPGKWSGSPRERFDRWILALQAYFGEPVKRRVRGAAR
jgi:hypothetical protein